MIDRDRFDRPKRAHSDKCSRRPGRQECFCGAADHNAIVDALAADVRAQHITAIGAALAAYAAPADPIDDLTGAEVAYLRGLYDGKWPAGNARFDRVAVVLARKLEVLND